MITCHDTVIRNLWHPLYALPEAPIGVVCETTLLEERLSSAVGQDGQVTVWRSRPEWPAGSRGAACASEDILPVKIAFGYVWTSLGDPPAELFPIPEYEEEDRRRLNAVTVGLNVSAPRAVENFLDMGHFPFVHTDILGAEPHTEVAEYDVQVSSSKDEIVATQCRFYQPLASSASTEGVEVEYVYRVPHPYSAVLYKSSPLDEARLDVIALFVTPVDEENIRAHVLMCVFDDVSDENEIRRFQHTILGQDKTILENQLPKRLPLDPRAETPIRADKSSIVYRRWLSQKGVRYGVIPVAA